MRGTQKAMSSTGWLGRLCRKPYIERFERAKLTLFHWGIKLTGKFKHSGGRISVADQEVLSRDVRVAWCLAKHASGNVASKPKRRRPPTSSRADSNDKTDSKRTESGASSGRTRPSKKTRTDASDGSTTPESSDATTDSAG